MTGHAYTEDQVVEQPEIALFAELGDDAGGCDREVWALLKDGVKVAVPDRERGGRSE